MKVTPLPKSSGTLRGRGLQFLRTLLRASLFVLVIGLFIAVVAVLVRPQYLQRAAVGLDQRWGNQLWNYDRALSDKWSIAVGSYLRQFMDGVPEIPELVIDVPFREITKIYAQRDEALERGKLVQGIDDFVKGEIRLKDRTVPIKLRLKGDWNDHLMGRKWSFRIRIRNNEQLFGLRRFSIQNPNTRGFQAELLYFEVMRLFDVMVPRYQFVTVTLNGESMGLMALEEFFSKELLEYNQRKEGVIVRFDESLAWIAKDAISGEDNGWGGAFDHFSNAQIDAIGSSRIAESPVLTKQYAIAAGLLNGFVDKKLTAAEVFDTQKLAAFIAVSDFFGSWHAIAWHNMRFYLNPITLRLEPIPFDATLQDHFEGHQSVINDEPILVQMLADPLVWQAYTDVLAELAQMIRDGSIKTLLRETEAPQLRILQTEFRMLGEFPLDYLQPRVEALLSRAKLAAGKGAANTNLYLSYENERDEYPIFAHLGLLETAGHMRLQIDNAIPRDVHISAIEWVNETNAASVSAVQKEVFPVALLPRGVGGEGRRIVLDLAPPPEPAGWALEVTAGLAGRDWVRQFRPARIYPARSTPPVPYGDLAQQLEAHPFLEVDDASNHVSIATGSWDVLESLIIPVGYSLHIQAGTTLSFAPDAILLSRGAVTFSGESAAPIILQALNGESWPGMLVSEAPERSLLRHVVVRDTRGVSLGDWALTGGTNFYRSDVDMVDCELLDSYGEDALNIVHSQFDISGTLIRGTASDAFDADFSTGTLTGSRFVEIGAAGGGDAVDVSGTQITVSSSEFYGISDKALSVGEKSTMRAYNITIDTVGTGAASKDGSILELSDTEISNASFAGLTAYIKKPEYGVAEIIATNVAIKDTRTPVLVQTGSRVQVDGEDSEVQDIDVDALYETIMRKGLR